MAWEGHNTNTTDIPGRLVYAFGGRDVRASSVDALEILCCLVILRSVLLPEPQSLHTLSSATTSGGQQVF